MLGPLVHQLLPNAYYCLLKVFDAPRAKNDSNWKISFFSSDKILLTNFLLSSKAFDSATLEFNSLLLTLATIQNEHIKGNLFSLNIPQICFEKITFPCHHFLHMSQAIHAGLFFNGLPHGHLLTIFKLVLFFSSQTFQKF